MAHRKQKPQEFSLLTPITVPFQRTKETNLFKFILWDSADAVGAKVCVPCLDASQATQVLVTLFLPLGDQILVRNIFLEAEIVEFCKGKWNLNPFHMNESWEERHDSRVGF